MPHLSSSEAAAPLPWVHYVVEKVQSLRFGSIQIKIHEGQVVGVEFTEQKRFNPSPKSLTAQPPPENQKPITATR